MKTPDSPARIEQSLRQRLLVAYRRDVPFQPERILIGFSGGPDSLALAILMAGIERAIPASVHLVHIDHRIRMQSDNDAQQCQELALALGLPLQIERIAEHPVALFPGVGLEEAARRGRYALLARMAGPRDLVALAHHQGDQAETLLLHLMRGAGLAGLAGMRPISEMQVPWWTDEDPEPKRLTVWRPLLMEQRADLLTVIGSHGLSPVLDESNDDLSLKRNAIRHRALPALRAIEPTIDARLGTLSRIVADEDAWLAEQTNLVFDRARLDGGGLSIEALNGAPVALARRVIRRWLQEGQRLIPTFDRVEAVLHLSRSGDEAVRIDAGDGLLVGCFGEALRCGTLEELRHRAWIDARLILPLAGSGASIRVDGDTISYRSAAFPVRTDAARVCQSPGAITVVTVRSAPEGNDGTHQWNEWFRRERISPWIRDLVQGVAVDGALWWIPRQGDYDVVSGGRLIRVVWSDQERN